MTYINGKGINYNNIITDNDDRCGDTWFLLGWYAGNFDITIMIRGEHPDDAIDSLGKYLKDHPERNLPYSLLIEPYEIDTDDEEPFPVNGGEYYIEMPVMITEP